MAIEDRVSRVAEAGTEGAEPGATGATFEADLSHPHKVDISKLTDSALAGHIEWVNEMEVVYQDLLQRVNDVVNAGYGDDLMDWIKFYQDKDEPGYKWMGSKLEMV